MAATRVDEDATRVDGDGSCVDEAGHVDRNGVLFDRIREDVGQVVGDAARVDENRDGGHEKLYRVDKRVDSVDGECAAGIDDPKVKCALANGEEGERETVSE